VFPGARSTLVQWGRDTAAANGVNLSGFDQVLVVQNYGVDHGAVAVGGPVVVVDQDPNLCEYGFICHEMGHGHGLPHSWSANPDKEYGDGWDLMSFQTTTFQFPIAFQGASGAATVGLNARNLQALNAVPAHRLWTRAAADFSEQVVLQPLNQPAYGNRGQLVASVPPAACKPPRPNGSSYTVEFHRKAGWDRAIPRDAVTVHEIRTNGFSYLPQVGHNLGVNDQYVTPDPKLWIRVTAIDPANETATVRIWDAPEGSLRREDSKPQVYLIQNGAKRWVTSPQALFDLGRTWADVKVVPDGALTGFPNGPDLYTLDVTVSPFPVPTNRAVTVTFSAVNSSGAAQNGTVKANGAVIGHTNVALTHTFTTTRRRLDGEWEVIYPTVTVTVPGFPTVTADCGWST
jgi:hypothetical protein